MSSFHDLSIRAELEKISPKHGATDLIALLLKNYAIELKESRRNLSSFNTLLGRSMLAFISIEKLIDSVNSTALTDFSAAWNDFENYTEAIPILERILFDFYLKVPTGLNHTARTLTPPADVSGGLIFLEIWIKDRQCILDTLIALSRVLSPRLPTITNELTGQWMNERRKDDMLALKALSDRLVALKPTDRWISQPRSSQLVSASVTLYQNTFKDLISQPPPLVDAWVVFSIKTMSLVLIPFEILSPTCVHSDKADFRSMEIWVKIKELLTAVSLANRAVDPTPELMAQWDALRDLLLSLGARIPLLQDMLALIQQAAEIRRPFQARSVRLIQMVRTLERHVAKNPNASDERAVLGVMKSVALPLLIKAQQTVPDVQQYRIDSEAYKGMESEFHSALAAVETCYKDFELDTQWDQEKTKYDDAVTNIDERHLIEFQARLSPTP